MKINNRTLKWVPTIASLILAAGVLVAYTALNAKRSAQIYIQVIVAAFAPAIFPIAGSMTKKDFSLLAGALTALHIFLSNGLGSALSFYELIPLWDLIMHGFFGVVFSVIISELLCRWGVGDLKRPARNFIIFLSTAGAAALWEVWEFVCDSVLDGDAQRVKEALANGANPIEDTMTDIAVTFVGTAIFILAELFFGKRAEKRHKKR